MLEAVTSGTQNLASRGIKPILGDFYRSVDKYSRVV